MPEIDCYLCEQFIPTSLFGYFVDKNPVIAENLPGINFKTLVLRVYRLRLAGLYFFFPGIVNLTLPDDQKMFRVAST